MVLGLQLPEFLASRASGEGFIQEHLATQGYIWAAEHTIAGLLHILHIHQPAR